MIIIKSKREGFRRCGVAHSSEGREFKNGTFTKDELKLLEDEAMLEVKYIVDEKYKGKSGQPDSDKDQGKNENQDKSPQLQVLIDVGKKVIEDGNVIGSGAPSVEAMSDTLGIEVNAAQRDIAWQAIQEENK